MKGLWKRSVAVCLTAAVVGGMTPNWPLIGDCGNEVKAAYPDKPQFLTGQLENGIAWEVDTWNNVLYVSGEGKIELTEERPPWDNYVHQISEIQIEEGITAIGEGIFKNYENLYFINLPNSLQSIEKEAFSGNKWLRVMAHSKTLKYIADDAFDSGEDCDITFWVWSPSVAEQYAMERGYEIISMNKGTCGENISFTYDEDSSSLTFSGTGFLYSYNWKGDFNHYAKNIYTVKFEEGVTGIDYYSLNNLTFLTDIIVPKSFTDFKEQRLPENLVIHGYPGTYAEEYAKANGYRFVSMEKETGQCGEELEWTYDAETGTLEIAGTGEMADYAERTTPWYQYKDEIQSVIVREGVLSIGDYAFGAGYSNLTSVHLPDTLQSIGDYAFYDCSQLNEITLPSSLVRIGKRAFSYCSSIKELTLPDSCPELGASAFASCQNLWSIVVPEGQEQLSENIFANCKGLRLISLPESLTIINDCAFAGCTGLIIETLPAGLTYIGDNAFEDCRGIHESTIPKNATIGRNAFRGVDIR